LDGHHSGYQPDRDESAMNGHPLQSSMLKYRRVLRAIGSTFVWIGLR
jgi:hypothetical protein